jgi:tetratricopeptide (TPR) repeat protein
LDLKPVSLTELLLETHHRGKVLVIRTFGHAIRLSGVQIAVEDSRGDVDRLALYNDNADLLPRLLLPTGALFAIKEPFYKKTADGGYNIRVDHPTDLKVASEVKEEANGLYKKGCLDEALESYTKALKLCSEGDHLLVCNILRNRSIVNLRLEHYEAALADAEASLIPYDMALDGRSEALNIKAHYRAGCAAYHCGDFASAESHFKTILDLEPSDKDATRELARTCRHLREQSTGVYDFHVMCQPASRCSRRLDHASHVSKTEVRDSYRKGRGLFATASIAPGELILCEKAFCVAFEEEHARDTYTIVNINTNRGAVGSRARLLFGLVHKMRYNPTKASQFFDLYDGGYSPKCDVMITDREAVIDTFRTQATTDYNAFAYSTKNSHVQPMENESMSAKEGSVSIWVRASYMNHACSGNATRTFCGDMMIVRASQQIDMGEEILTPYCLPEGDNTATHELLKKNWGFRCNYVICIAEVKSSVSQKTRLQLYREVKAFLSLHRHTITKRPPKTTISQAEKMYQKYRDAYDNCFP